MKYRIVGSGVGAAYLALRLAQEKLQVPGAEHSVPLEIEWYAGAVENRLRPLRLTPPVFHKLRLMGTRGGERMEFLSRAPEFEAWGTPSGPRYHFSFSVFENGCDRWVDSQELFDTLRRLVTAAGVSVRERSLLKAPFEVLEARRWGEEPVFVDAEAKELLGWPLVKNSDVPRKIEALELWLPRGRIDVASACQFHRLEGALCFLEPHPHGGFALSIYAQGRYAVERALQAIKNPKGAAPSAWRALMMLNPGARCESRTMTCGASGYDLPGAFLLGRSIGSLPPGSNLHDSDNLEQVEELVEMIRKGLVVGQNWLQMLAHWNERESRRFASGYKRAEATEKWLFSDKTQPYALGASALMPRSLRHFLKSPV